jgi:hypothetical protein
VCILLLLPWQQSNSLLVCNFQSTPEGCVQPQATAVTSTPHPDDPPFLIPLTTPPSNPSRVVPSDTPHKVPLDSPHVVPWNTPPAVPLGTSRAVPLHTRQVVPPSSGASATPRVIPTSEPPSPDTRHVHAHPLPIPPTSCATQTSSRGKGV